MAAGQDVGPAERELKQGLRAPLLQACADAAGSRGLSSRDTHPRPRGKETLSISRGQRRNISCLIGVEGE